MENIVFMEVLEAEKDAADEELDYVLWEGLDASDLKP